MIQKKINSLSMWFFESLLRHEEIRHFVSTRIGGASSAPYESLNLSFGVGDDPQNVLKNRKLLAGALGIQMTSLTCAKQVHDAHVRIVSEGMRGKGAADYESAINGTDAMVTNAANICLTILVADCVPILFYDPSKRVIGTAHAGWKGAIQQVAKKTVTVFRQDFGCLPQDIIVGIGPSIGPCCYEVGSEVISQAKDVFGTKEDCMSNESADGKAYFDLKSANLKQLLQAGIPEKNIEVPKTCTCDHSDLFFSYRHEKGKTGRFGAGIVIIDDLSGQGVTASLRPPTP